MSEKQKIAIVSGATGMDGSHLIEFLLRKGYFVVGLKRRVSNFNTERVDHLYLDPNFKLRYYDLNDSSAIYQLLIEYNPDEFYMLAAQSQVHTSFEIPEHTVEGIVMGTLRILNAIKLVCPNCRVYNSGSSEMFGVNQKMPLNEESQMLPASPYACAKLFTYNICRNYRAAYGMHISNGILFNHTSQKRGPIFFERKLTMGVARIVAGIQDKIYFGNLDSKRDIGSAKEYVQCMWKMLQREEPDDYCIATGKNYSMREMAEFLFNYVGLGDYRKYIEIDTRLYRPQEVDVLLGDSTKAKEKLGWEPKKEIFDLLVEMYEHDLLLAKQEIAKSKVKWEKGEFNV